MTPTKEALLAKLNQQAEAAHQEAVEKAHRLSKRAPDAPVPLVPEQVEFPKWVHRGWAAPDKTGRQVAAESELASNEKELKALEAQGFSELPVVKAEKSKKE